MKKILLIIKREYTSRIRKPAFIIMSFLGPVIFSLTLILPAWFSRYEDTELKTIAVIDSSHLFNNKIANSNRLKFVYLENANLQEIKKNLGKYGYWGVLYISHVVTYTPSGVILYSYKQPNLSIKLHIKNSLEKEIEKEKLRANNIKDIDRILASVKTDVSLRTIEISQDGIETEKDHDLATLVAWISGFLIYFFIFFFGSQVMRGVIEEKTSRIVEIIVSSVRPFQLMMGKIVGIGLLGLTQFTFWCLLTFGIIMGASKTFFPELTMTPTEMAIQQDIMNGDIAQVIEDTKIAQTESAAQMGDILSAFKKVNFGLIIISFIFFFLGGYLLYASLFAAIGSAGDSDTDIQQFMLPVTIPLIAAMMILMSTVNDPDSQLSVFCSIFPLTSPIIMMARIPYGVPVFEYVLSIAVLIGTFLFTTWTAGKIYRTGILMYGKKISYKEIWKWIRHK